MKKLKINDNILSKLPKLNVNSINIESDLYIVENKYLLKKFIETDVDFLQEKEQKIKYLADNIIEGTVPVLSYVISNNQFIGYLMPYIKDSVELKEIEKLNIDQDSLIEIMYQLSQTLEQMHQKNIIYGDISESNIIVDKTLNPYFVDMDGALVNNIGISNIPKLLFDNKFIEDFTPSIELDITLLNMLFVNILSKQKASVLNRDEFISVVNNLEINQNLKQYFKQIPNGLQSEYATKYLGQQLNKKHIK